MAFIILFLLFSLLLLSSLFLTGAGRRHRLPLPPGPKGWPLLGNLLQLGSNPHQTLYTLSRSYGCGLLRLRFGTVDVIVVSSASAAAKCFRNHDANFSGRPPNSTGKHITYNFQGIVMAPYGQRWRMLKKLCAVHLFSNKALDGYKHVRDEEVGRLVRELAGRSRETSTAAAPIDVGGLVNMCVTNTLARVLVGRRVLAGGEEAEQFKEMAVEMAKLAGQFNVGDFVPGIDWLDVQGIAKKMKKIRERFGEFLEKITVEHRLKAEDQFKGNNHVNDFLSVLIKMNGDVEGEQDKLTDTNIKALLQDLFLAGTDTTSIMIEWVLSELIRHPNIHARAQHELDSIVGCNRLVSESDLPSFPLLNAIVKETLRLHPAVPLSIPHNVAEDCEVDGYLIPKGATLLLNIWAIGRDPTSWPKDPLEFQPDRFIMGSQHENIDVKGNDFELIPFDVGRRICAGMSLALRIVHFLTAMLIHSFDWTLPDDQTADKLDMEESFGVTMRKTKPLVAHAKPRLAPQAYL